jgi:two-component system response regulator FixJ
VLDMAMPNMTGAECFELLRARLPALPVLIASGYSRTDDVERLLTHGAVAMLDKPFDRAELLGALDRLCGS